MGDPLGLTPKQRQVSDMTVTYGELFAEILTACPLCRAYECLPSCLSRQAREAERLRAWTETSAPLSLDDVPEMLRLTGAGDGG